MRRGASLLADGGASFEIEGERPFQPASTVGRAVTQASRNRRPRRNHPFHVLIEGYEVCARASLHAHQLLSDATAGDPQRNSWRAAEVKTIIGGLLQTG
jgi:hypothetical protein